MYLKKDSYKFIFKKSPALAFSCEFCQTFQGTFFAEHFRVTASTKHSFARWVDLSLKMLLLTCSFRISVKHFQS